MIRSRIERILRKTLDAKWLSRLKKSYFFKHGAPFLVVHYSDVFVIGGSFALSQFTTIRYDVATHKQTYGLTPEVVKKFGSFKHKSDIDEEYQKMKQKLDVDNWKNIRGPREYEELSPEYKELIEKLKNKKKQRDKEN